MHIVIGKIFKFSRSQRAFFQLPDLIKQMDQHIIYHFPVSHTLLLPVQRGFTFFASAPLIFMDYTTISFFCIRKFLFCAEALPAMSEKLFLGKSPVGVQKQTDSFRMRRP